MIIYNPGKEIEYRYRLAVQYLNDAENAYNRRDWRFCVASAQMAVENAAKTLISIHRIPSWSHDPSRELLELIDKFPKEYKEEIEELANYAHILAPEYARTSYGDPILGLTPWELYNEEYARKCLEIAKKAIKIMKKIIKTLLGIEN